MGSIFSCLPGFLDRVKKPYFTSSKYSASVRPSLPFLPPELLEYVIDYLRADRDALLACSLAGKDLFHAARYHLTWELRLTPKKLEGLYHLLRHPRSTISHFTTHLILSDVCVQYDHHRPIESKYDSMSVITMPQRLQSFISLHAPTVTTRCYMWERTMSSFQHIRHLDIVKVEFNTFIDFVQLVRSFPVLETLSVSLLQWQPSILKIDYSAYQLRRPIRMRLVDLLEKSAADVAHWLLAHNPTPRIDTLHFETNKPESNKIMHQLIMACGPSINELKFELAFASETEAHLEDSIGIRNCVNLQHLHLHNIILFSGYPMTGAITRRVPVLLSQVTSTQIREVVFTVLICQKEHLDLLNWESVTEILSGPRFANLMTVRVRVPGSVVTFDRAEVARQLREDKLSVFHGRGMVVLEFPGALGAY